MSLLCIKLILKLPILRAVHPFPLSLEFICNLFLTNGQLDKDGEEEEDGLVGGGEVDPTVEADQEDQLDQQGGVDNGVGETRAKPEEEGEQTIEMLQHHDHSARDVTGMKGVEESQQLQKT